MTFQIVVDNTFFIIQELLLLAVIAVCAVAYSEKKVSRLP
jgi:hypothetical protein